LVPNNNYTNTAVAIQEASKMRMWVVIPAVTKRLCIIECTSPSICAPLHHSVEQAVKKATAAGCTVAGSVNDTFLAGHSLGGTCAQQLVQAYHAPYEYHAMITMGSYVDETGEGDLINYPIPVLTLGAELDGGMARPGKLTLWYEQFQNVTAATSKALALQTSPVIVLPRQDHSDFCPGFNVSGDLPSETDPAVASANIGAVSAAFLQLNSAETSAAAKADAQALLAAHAAVTDTLLAPISETLALGTSAGANGMFVKGLGWAVSPWCRRAQHLMADLSPADDARLTVLDTYRDGASDKPGDNGTAFEHCHTNQTASPGGGNGIVATSCSHNAYYKDVDNTGTFICANEVGCKMASAGAIQKALGIGGGSDPRVVTCKDINKAAVAEAVRVLGNHNPVALQRYQTRGRKFCFADDLSPPGGIAPLWIKETLKLVENATCLTVTSYMEFSALKSKIYPGNAYCKLLSPARALDWMLTDSLKPFKK
jgi:hypothetical protein